jgi:hypothetical protein
MEAPRAEGGTSVSTPVLKDTLLVELRVMGKASKLVTCEQGSFWNLVRVFRQGTFLIPRIESLFPSGDFDLTVRSM